MKKKEYDFIEFYTITADDEVYYIGLEQGIIERIFKLVIKDYKHFDERNCFDKHGKILSDFERTFNLFNGRIFTYSDLDDFLEFLEFIKNEELKAVNRKIEDI